MNHWPTDSGWPALSPKGGAQVWKKASMWISSFCAALGSLYYSRKICNILQCNYYILKKNSSLSLIIVHFSLLWNNPWSSEAARADISSLKRPEGSSTSWGSVFSTRHIFPASFSNAPLVCSKGRVSFSRLRMIKSREQKDFYHDIITEHQRSYLSLNYSRKQLLDRNIHLTIPKTCDKAARVIQVKE